MNDLPEQISNPAKRALANAGIDSLARLSKFTEREILKLHGMGPATLPLLREALTANGKYFKPEKEKNERRYKGV